MVYHLIFIIVLWTKYYFSHFTYNKSEFREVKQLVEGHMAGNWCACIQYGSV